MHCGIRQGCQMAPLLFILALDSAYKVFRVREDINGITLHAADHVEPVTVSGYADDTAIYLRHRGDLPNFLRFCEAFKSVSGRSINKAKFLVVVLGRCETMVAAHTHGLTLLKPTGTYRYLGIQVGQADASIIYWDKCFQSVWARLSLERQKTHCVEQRALLVRAIALSNFCTSQEIASRQPPKNTI